MVEGGGPRRRGAVLEEAILRAAAEVLRESGAGGLTMDEVARRAGTNKNAIYRRWPNRVALGVAAYRRLADAEITVPDTGSLRDDALDLLSCANSTWSSPYGEILRGLIAAAGSAPELLAELRDGGGGAYEAAWLTVLGRAVARGEAVAEALHPRVASTPVALLRNEYMTRGVPAVPDGVLVEIVEEVFLPLVRGRAGFSA
ncbi:AcrR family transcriptional regulator [Actinomadura coerulea]|uniref:AcrR family transcriptional regulator n=1 Tax=Actinomadura coerulea TaxID=46159 RepID=A0A7X0L1M3_9ACTN|nr:TetR/AcrR family transcriptional regulator [Actinomadura coerulea]MBB6398672.1 AcrR family transcriptional regulator [Actinomadura coerulea]GGQ00169.1 TetR family transcriptional regulator [Actinomadura coerulea]